MFSVQMLTDGDMSLTEELCDSDMLTLTQKDDTDEDEEDEADVDAGSFEEVEEPQDRTMRGCLRSRPCTVSVYLLIVLVLIAGLVALIVVGVLVVDPYRSAANFKMAQCKTVKGYVDVDRRRCSCGKGCSSKYPCIHINVTHNHMDKNKSMEGTPLFENEATLNRQCSYYPPCKSSRVANEQAVRQYEAKYGKPNQQYSCLYNPNNPSEVIRTRRFHLRHVIHGMVWSSLIFLLSLAILIFAIKKKGCDFL